MKAKRFAFVDVSHCVACGACEKVCPRAAIKVVKGSFAQVDEEKCIGCLLCGRTCPAGTIIAKEA